MGLSPKRDFGKQILLVQINVYFLKPCLVLKPNSYDGIPTSPYGHVNSVQMDVNFSSVETRTPPWGFPKLVVQDVCEVVECTQKEAAEVFQKHSFGSFLNPKKERETEMLSVLLLLLVSFAGRASSAAYFSKCLGTIYWRDLGSSCRSCRVTGG